MVELFYQQPLIPSHIQWLRDCPAAAGTQLLDYYSEHCTVLSQEARRFNHSHFCTNVATEKVGESLDSLACQTDICSSQARLGQHSHCTYRNSSLAHRQLHMVITENVQGVMVLVQSFQGLTMHACNSSFGTAEEPLSHTINVYVCIQMHLGVHVRWLVQHCSHVISDSNTDSCELIGAGKGYS